MNVKRKPTQSDSPGDKAKALLVAVLLTAAMLGAGASSSSRPCGTWWVASSASGTSTLRRCLPGVGGDR